MRKIFAEGKSDRDVLLLSSFCVFSRPFELGVTLGSCPPNVGFCGLKIHASFPFPFFSSSFFFGESLLVRKTFVSGGSPPPPPTKPYRPTMGETGLILSPLLFSVSSFLPPGRRRRRLLVLGNGRAVEDGKLFLCSAPPFFLFFFLRRRPLPQFDNQARRTEKGRREKSRRRCFSDSKDAAKVLSFSLS